MAEKENKNVKNGKINVENNNTNSCIKSVVWIFNSNKKPNVFINFNEKKIILKLV